MPKSLLLVFPALLLAAPMGTAAKATPQPIVAAGRTDSPDARAVWFGMAMDHILDGRTADNRASPPRIDQPQR